MKNIKKLLSIIMVLTLVLALGTQAFAATVSIEGPAGHTYKAYKIFSGTTVTVDGAEKLASIEWANPAGSAALLAALAADGTIGSSFNAEMSAEEAAEAMGKLETADQKQALARVLIENKASLLDAGAVENGTNLEPGYYAIEDTTNVTGENDSKNAIVLEVVGSEVIVNNKHDVPESEKKVQDRSDLTGADTGWQDSADWDIGDEVPFQITGTLPTNLNEYETYTLIFHDNQSAGLTFLSDSVEVTVGGQAATLGTDYTVKTPGSEEGCTFEIVFENIKAVAGAENGAQVVVTYKSELNENAVIGIPGNPNTMYMEFSNNPGGEGTGKTPEHKVIVFTFDLDVNKVDGDTQPLEGAEFALYKAVPEGTDGAFQLTKDGKKVIDGKVDGEAVDPADLLDANKWYIDSPNALSVDPEDATKFYADGLDDGEYVIVETKTPDGYNTADPTSFTIEANHESESGEPMTPEQLVITGLDKKGDNTGALATVVNRNGLELPETGGIGTTIFYVVGAILVAGAVIILVTKKRMTGTEK